MENPHSILKKVFGYDSFRPGQEEIVSRLLAGQDVLAVMPTGAGKSICYQVPALLLPGITIVVSPLVSLMKDQVGALVQAGVAAAFLNNSLNDNQKALMLRRAREGWYKIIYVAPERLEMPGFQRFAQEREISMVTVDEAHCISQWGQDFRPSYLRIKAFVDSLPKRPVVGAFTATATAHVREDIRTHLELHTPYEVTTSFDRPNLYFATRRALPSEKPKVLLDLVLRERDNAGIIYCSTTRQVDETTRLLQSRGIRAAAYHAKLDADTRRQNQDDFLYDRVQIMVATNAFGMGIDKPDVRLVLHADIPGSLENYVQEAGRAGRDQQPARCVLLYAPDDVERQFSLSAHSRLSQRDIQAVLRAVRKLDSKKRGRGEIVATAGEILAEDPDGDFERDRSTDDTSVRTALAWLEEAGLLTREENRVQVFPSCLRVAGLEEARTRIEKKILEPHRRALLTLAETLLHADADEGISTDELMGIAGMNATQLRAALSDLEHLGIVGNDTVITAFVHAGVEHASRRRLERATRLEIAVVDALQSAAPDLAKNASTALNLRHLAQMLKDAGHADALPERLMSILQGLAGDGRNEGNARGSLRLRRSDREMVAVTLQRAWADLKTTAERRRAAAERLLEHWLAALPAGARGTDLLAETTMGKLMAAIESDLVLKAESRDLSRLLDRALLWLHEQEILRLGKGLAIFRPAMTLKLVPDRRNFTQIDFKPLKLHYDAQRLQIHVMAEYARRALIALAEALQLALDYFRLPEASFLQRWLPDREQELARQTTPASWQAIVTALNNRDQQRIVADDRDQAHVLVLAGPGSGKTRILVHRIAYLLRVRREHPRGILALAYNHHAAVQIRQRLRDLVGDDAQGVTVLTCHAFAMRLVGARLQDRTDDQGDDYFKQVLRDALALLKGEGLPPEEADEQRDRLLAGFRWILVDEYQDIGPDEYELIAAIAGRSLQDEERKLSLFAVGDDDQNIYAFKGASVAFIRRFEADYAARPVYLLDNYRSTAHIIDAANTLIRPAAERLKADHPIRVNQARRGAPFGGGWQTRDAVGHGRVQVLPAGGDPRLQAMAIMTELRRLATLAPDWNWARCAVIAREWQYLQPVRSYCEREGIPVQMANENMLPLWRLRETQALLDWLRREDRKEIDSATAVDWITAQSPNPWWSLLGEAIQAHGLETAGAALPVQHLMDWLAEWGRQIRRRQSGLLLTTAHGAKGLEFDHVAVLDGGWDKTGAQEDGDAVRRLYYVAMTRARQTLTLARLEGREHRFLDDLSPSGAVQWREPVILPPPAPELAWRHEPLTLADVDLGYAGRRPPDDGIHAAIAALRPGDALSLDVQSGYRLLRDERGQVVGRLSQHYQPPARMGCQSARVAAVLVRRDADGEERYRRHLRCQRWEVVIPELIFAPVAGPIASRPRSHEQRAAHPQASSPMAPTQR